MNQDKEKYFAIDLLKVMAAIGIILMHVRANSGYDIHGFLYNRIIPSFTDGTFLFMAISAFGLMCGYFSKYLEGTISWELFYAKRIKKIWPFFAILVCLDVILSLSYDSIHQGLTDLTLLYGFLPDSGNIEVIGVGWFIGLIVVFYLCFPFFCFVMSNRKRAWSAFVISVLCLYLGTSYYKVGRSNIFFSFIFFVVGGIVFLYREQLRRVPVFISFSFLLVEVIGYYVFPNIFFNILITTTLLAICVRYGEKKDGIIFIKIKRRIVFLSSISMEMYLSHMLIFRGLEKIGFSSMPIGNACVQYIVMCILTIIGAIVFSIILKVFLEKVQRSLSNPLLNNL